MIIIKKSPVADTRTCDWSKVKKSELLDDSMMHISDVSKGIYFLIDKMRTAAKNHDKTKISNIDEFYQNFKTGFKSTEWYDMHQSVERHHLDNPKYVQEDVNLIDILEMIVDGAMAAMARKGKYIRKEFSPEVLVKAFENTITLVLDNIAVEKYASVKTKPVDEFEDPNLYEGKTFEIVGKDHPHYGEKCICKEKYDTGVGFGLIMIGDYNDFVVFDKKDIKEL